MKQSETNEAMIHSLIIEDLEQTISAEDKVKLEEWRNASAVNARTYSDFADIQLNLDKLYHRNGYDPDHSWTMLDQKITSTEQERKTFDNKPGYGKSFWIRAAAALFLISTAGYFLANRQQYQVVDTTENSAISKLVLPDGTELALNSGTIIKYDKKNFSRDRKLILESGEVFIHVIKHDGNQFSIDLGDVEVKDIGTSFNVTKNDSHASVVVEEGKVAMIHDSGEEVLLSQGMRGIFYAGSKQLEKQHNKDLNYKSWLNKKFIFNATPLQQVAIQLEKAYKVPLIIEEDNLKLKKLTAKLHYQTLDSALEVISASLQCKVTKAQNAYVLSGSQ